MEYHNGAKFSTHDQDNDWFEGNCAVDRHGAWWYSYCHTSNLNGAYGTPGVSGHRYNAWYHWKNKYESLIATTMKLRPKT
jgi:ficolin